MKCIECKKRKKIYCRGLCDACYAKDRFKNPVLRVKHRKVCLDYYYRNRERCLAMMKKWQDKNREKLNAEAREYYWRNRKAAAKT